MANSILDIIIRYEKLRGTLRHALEEAGGNPDIILNQPQWLDVLATLAANNITIDAYYTGHTRD